MARPDSSASIADLASRLFPRGGYVTKAEALAALRYEGLDPGLGKRLSRHLRAAYEALDAAARHAVDESNSAARQEFMNRIEADAHRLAAAAAAMGLDARVVESNLSAGQYVYLDGLASGEVKIRLSDHESTPSDRLIVPRPSYQVPYGWWRPADEPCGDVDQAIAWLARQPRAR